MDNVEAEARVGTTPVEYVDDETPDRDNESENPEAPPPAKSGIWRKVILAALAVVVIGAGGAWYWNYPASTAGLVMAPRGIAAALGMASVAVLINRIGPRRLVLTGLVLAGLGTYQMTGYSLQVDMYHLILPSLIQGYGMGMVFVPLSALAFQTIDKNETDRASSIFNLARTIGSSIGIAIAATVLTRMSQTCWMSLGGHITPYNPIVAEYLAERGLSMSDTSAPQMLANELARQSNMLGFLDAFYFIAMSFVVLAPLVVLLGGDTPDSTS